MLTWGFKEKYMKEKVNLESIRNTCKQQQDCSRCFYNMRPEQEGAWREYCAVNKIVSINPRPAF